VVNLYDGVEYLNGYLYALPDTHCTRPIELALTASKNRLACGTKFADSSVAKNKKGSAEKYCGAPPVEPQQIFFECRNSLLACVSTSVSVAYGTVGSVGAVITVVLMLLVHNVLGLKGEEGIDTGDAVDAVRPE